MTTFAILATGPSMSQAIADVVQSRCSVVAVSDAFRLAPWADALVSQDQAWWKKYPEAKQFAGRKFSCREVAGVEKLPPGGVCRTDANSGLIACQVAVNLGATRILMLGFDMAGAHYFGPHPAGLKNTPPDRYKVFLKMFEAFNPAGVEVLNCTPGSRLTRFPFATLEEIL